MKFFLKREGWALLFLGGGLALVCLGGIWGIISWDFTSRAVRTEGIVIEMVQRGDSDGGTFAPVFSFYDVSGIQHVVHSSFSSYPPNYRTGDKITVLYLESDPKGARENQFFALWGLPAVFGGIGISYTFLGLILRYWPEISRKYRKIPPVYL